MNTDNELTKLIIAEKDKIKLNYKQKLNNIKQRYGIDFDVDYFKNENIKDIHFRNLDYKNELHNISLTYNNSNHKISYLMCEFSDSRVVKNTNSKKILSSLEKEYKLKIVVEEINRANQEYIKELHSINMTYSNNIEEDNLILDRTLQLKNDNEN